jgi:TonB family protein
MRLDDCARAESNAGALALGEASEEQRDEYRAHVARCAPCLNVLGGERDIERTMRLVAVARDEESWAPQVEIDFKERAGVTRHAWQFGLAAAAVALLWFGARAFVPVAGTQPAEHVAVVAHQPVTTTSERSATAGHDLVVLHNVATLKRPPLVAAAPVHPQLKAVAIARRTTSAPAPAAQPPVAHASPAPALVAVTDPSQRDERSVSALRTVGTAPPAPQRAESIAVMPAPGITRDAAPLGGEYAIVPHPPAIAYYENAEGTTAFEVSVDERGAPVKCTIVKSSGFLVLDDAVCRAAMRARYAPRTVNGRAVPGIYRDALTFQAGDER